MLEAAVIYPQTYIIKWAFSSPRKKIKKKLNKFQFSQHSISYMKNVIKLLKVFFGVPHLAVLILSFLPSSGPSFPSNF